MARWEPTETRVIALSSSSQSENFMSICKGVYLMATADCYVDFDRPATTGSFLIKANEFVHMEAVTFTQLHAVGTSGNLHIVALRG